MEFWSIVVIVNLLILTVQARWLHPPMRSVSEFSFERYQGRWYEIAQSKVAHKHMREHCRCSYGHYEIQYDPVYKVNFAKVKDYCTKDPASEPDTVFEGYLYQWHPHKKPGALSIERKKRPPGYGNYYVLALGNDKDYGYALIGEPWRRYLWVLSRNRTMSEETFGKLKHIARHHGYMLKLNPLIRVSQENCPSVARDAKLDPIAPVSEDHPLLQIQEA